MHEIKEIMHILTNLHGSPHKLVALAEVANSWVPYFWAEADSTYESRKKSQGYLRLHDKSGKIAYALIA